MSRIHHRLLAAGLIAGLSTVTLAGTAQATTVESGSRDTVQVATVSPTALPASLEAGSTRRTSQVTITL
ncbi:hypothetical protein [Kineococcus sp. SYSU DK003]|uniref:hypothetical protein n=1 Tax=Kineococcus sp. SYSU DK003 TaxID=3383124 RepID=UPI003D7EA7A3